jgi:NitT/TauT family transport system substrate-binding protein
MSQEATTHPPGAGPVSMYGLLLAAIGAVAGLLWLLSTASVNEEPQMRVGLVAAPENEPIGLARDVGMIDNRRVTVVEFCSFEDLHNAFVDGNVHAGVFTLDDALELRRPPFDARVERFVAISRHPLDLVCLRPGLRLGDLRHRRIGLERGRRPMFALREILRHAGIGLEEVELDQVDSDSGREALAQGRVDAVLTYPPYGDELVRAGGHVLGRWESPAPGELFALLANPKAHRLAPGQIAHLLDAWRAGSARARNPDSLDMEQVARRETIAPGEVPVLLASVRFLGDEDDQQLRSADGRDQLDRFLAAVRERWQGLGVADTVSAAVLLGSGR